MSIAQKLALRKQAASKRAVMPNATYHQLRARKLELQGATWRGIAYLRMYSYMVKGELRVKLYGVYNRATNEPILQTQIEYLQKAGWTLINSPGAIESYVMYIKNQPETIA